MQQDPTSTNLPSIIEPIVVDAVEVPLLETLTKQNPNLQFLVANQGSARIIALQGSARSGKTFSTLQFLIALTYYYSGLILSVVRGSMPALRATALRDYKDILMSAQMYDENNELKPSGYYEYSYNGNVTEFFSVENSQKVRGRKRHILYINEANEITLEQFRQLAMRTEGLIIIDYNPSDPESYIYDHVLTRSDCKMLITTYKDNPHLPQSIVDEIELLQDTDPEYWKVFGQGIRGNVSGVVYGHYKVLERDLWPTNKGPKAYGLDFGYSAPMALEEVTFYDGGAYVRQLFYRTKHTTPMLIAEMKKLDLDPTAIIYCDGAEPDRIQELADAGFNAVAADKSWIGIDTMRSTPLYLHEDSRETIDEVKQYRYMKDKVTGQNLEKPIGIDHGMDATRYAIHTHKKNNNRLPTSISKPQGRQPIQL